MYVCVWLQVCLKYQFFIGKVFQMFISNYVVITFYFAKCPGSLAGDFYLHTRNVRVRRGVSFRGEE